MAGGVAKEDLALLNFCWMYKAGLITQKSFIEGIDRLPNSISNLGEKEGGKEIKEYIEMTKTVKDLCSKYGKENVLKSIEPENAVKPNAAKIYKRSWADDEEILKKKFHKKMSDEEKAELCTLLNRKWQAIYFHANQMNNAKTTHINFLGSKTPHKKNFETIPKVGRPHKIQDEDIKKRVAELNDGKLSGQEIADIIYKEFKFKIHRNTVLKFIGKYKEANNLNCPYCDSTNITKKGLSHTQERGDIQRYKCKDCGGSFAEDDEYHRMKNNPELIKEVIKLHNLGLSIREIQKKVQKVSHVTVFDWINKFEDADSITDPQEKKDLKLQRKQMEDNDYMNKIEEAERIKEELKK
jgi:transposase-like protein